jgi:PEP-CTERM motif
MFKKLFSTAAVVALTLWVTGTAQATPITFTDLIAPAVPVYLNGDTSPKTHTVTHDITDGVPLPAFIPGFHTVSEATLKMTLDDDVPNDTGEFIKITVGGTDYGPWEVELMDVFLIPLNGTALADLNLDGKLSAKITMTNRGDLNFVSSELVANTTPTPEPSTWVLFGSGLAGVVGFSLRRRTHEEENSTVTVAS